MAHAYPLVNIPLAEPCPPWQPSGDVPFSKDFLNSHCVSGPLRGTGDAGISRTAPCTCSHQAYMIIG